MNKKGFTLIELLAVIVILAIIMVIATPAIANVIEDARKGAFKNSAQGIIKAAEQKYMLDKLETKNENLVFEYENGEIVGENDLNYKGTRPENGKVMVNTLGQVALAIHNGKYCVEKDYEDAKVTLSEKALEDCLVTGETAFACGGNLVDTRDGNTYKTVQMGDQCWMAENLRYTENDCLSKTWNSSAPHDACRTHDTDWGEEVLYQWGAAMNGSIEEKSQGLCAEGWYIPTYEEWTILSDYVGGIAVTGTKLKSLTKWNGTDDYGFNALPAGGRNGLGNLYDHYGTRSYWWSSSSSGSNAWEHSVSSGSSYLLRFAYDQVLGHSIRCVWGQ